MRGGRRAGETGVREMPMRHGGQILVDQLRLHDVSRVFSIPGESFLAALDGLYDSGIENIVCRQEGGAAMMAEADGKLTGRPGVLFVTRGPGATNASSGLHVAMQDSTPLVCFIGQVPSRHRDREAFQEVDYTAAFAPIVKWVAEVHSTDRLAEYIARAFSVAQSGRPGPVVLSLPEDMLSTSADVPDLPPPPARMVPDYSPVAAEILAQLGQAERPLIIAGGSSWSEAAARDLATLASHSGAPVCTTFRRQDYLDNRHPNYAGDLGVGTGPKLTERMAAADVILALGTRLGETATNAYTLLNPARPLKSGRTLIHVHPDPDELGRNHRADLAIAAPAASVLADLARAAEGNPAPPPSDWTTGANADWQAWRRPAPSPGDLKLEDAIRWMSDHLPDEAILTNGAGNYAAWAHRCFAFKRFGTQLGPTSGSMGYGLPAAIAAKLRHPDRPVICLAGDGCLQMTIQELSTAAQYRVPIMVLVINNGQYGTIRMHQERDYPGRISGTALFLPDIPTLAQAYGGIGETVRHSDDFPAAFTRAAGAEKLAIIELVTDPNAIAPGRSLA